MKDRSESLNLAWDKKREAFFETEHRCTECREPILDNFALKGKCRRCLRQANGKAFRERHPDYYKNYEKGKCALSYAGQINPFLDNPFLDKKLPTTTVIKEKAKRIRKAYMKRLEHHEGRRPDYDLLMTYALYLLYIEREFNKIGNLLMFFQCFNFKDLGYNCHWEEPYFYWSKIYRWRFSPAFKEMQWQEAWDDLRIAYEISHENAGKKEMSQREIQRKHRISKKDLEDLTGFILSQHAGNKKISNKFTFDRPA